ncbi:kinase-like domain-containing protein [Pseudoneurospora amorphoporcata]|uniref:Kinase-like domain-containing protein n=1 Tax=Pseudoneurospora amorphoporcata TaxID=241081 RepID=A0AAN6NLW5_9PEZI|nr:kinase-like domain-containing protein [Pseudoneurospora amorphoporcata]
MPVQEAELEGLEWVQTTFSLEPRWTIDPDINSIGRTIKSLLQGQETVVSFLTQGAFNKIYDVAADSQALILRVSLPVDPGHKTLSEVATIDWTQRHTSLPVPELIAHDATRATPIGFEWILMRKLPGKTLADAWKDMKFSAKEQLVKQIASYYADMFGNQLRGIGNIYPDSLSPLQNDPPPPPPSCREDGVNAILLGGSYTTGCSSGPLPVECRMDNRFDEEDEVEDTQRTLDIITRLKSSVNNFFPDCGQDSEFSMLLHDDLSQHNILVDQDGRLTGVVDWECPPREEAPDRATYRHNSDGEPDSLYWEHVEEYELTKLRRYLLSEMRRLKPKWIEVFDSAVSKRDFYLAVQNCGSEFHNGDIINWLDEISMGHKKIRSLRDRFDES